MRQVEQLAAGIARRINAEPDLDDFLAWTAGTLEYWVHVIASSVGKSQGWASSTEVPYITAAPNPGTKSNSKWADGAMLLERVGVLLEVKTVAARDGVAGKTLAKIPLDLAALVALDWPATLAQPEDAYSGKVWATMRARMEQVCALQLALVHGPVGQLPDVASVADVFRRQSSVVESRLRAAALDGAADKLSVTFHAPPEVWPVRGETHEGILFGWLVPLM
jgi:hypothetical protein